MKFRLALLTTCLLTVLTACNFSLAEDITPPPGYLSPTPPATIGPLYPAVPPSPARGAVIYAKDCQPCHGANGLGNGPLAAQMPVAVPAIGLRDISDQSVPADWFTVITAGHPERGMPAFSDLSAGERWDVLAYVYTLSTTAAELQRGAVVYNDRCSDCHVPPPGRNGSQPTGLDPAPTDFTDQSFMSRATGTGFYRSIVAGVASAMPAFGGQLSENDLWALAAYVRSLSFDMSPLTVVSTPASSPTPAAGTPALGTTFGEATPTGTASGVNAGTLPAADVTVSGTVTNGSGGILPAGLTAILHGFTNQQETVNLDTPLDPDGAFKFEHVSLASGMEFIVVVKYGPASFLSQVGVYDGTQTSFDQSVTIYDSTSDLAALSLDQVHIQASFPSANEIHFDEIYVLTNLGKTAVTVKSDGNNLPFASFPEGALQPTVSLSQSSAPLIPADNGFAILPGSQQYAFVASFSQPYDQKTSLVQPFSLAPSSVTVIVPVGVHVQGDRLTDQGTSNLQGSTYQLYNSGPLTAGDVLTMTVSGTPKSSSTATGSLGASTALMVGMAALGLALVAAGIYLFLHDRNRREAEDTGERREEVLSDEAGRIADAILALDDQFAAGEISGEDYEQRRVELKESLRSLL